MWLGLLLACSDYDIHSIKRVDIFKQNLRKAVDVVFVIDNSRSMLEEQEHLSTNFDALVDNFLSADVDWQLTVTTTEVSTTEFRGRIVGGDDALILSLPDGTVIDQVSWSANWNFDAGVALQLDPNKASTSQNDEPAAWCAATTSFGSDRGTPGNWNPTCEGVTTEGPKSNDNPARPPQPGEIAFTEIMAVSSGVDSLCEWTEITNLGEDPLTLDGLVLSDNGSNWAELPSGLTLPGGSALVLGRSETDNCDTPVDVSLGDDMVLADPIQTVDANTAEVHEQFSEMASVGSGSLGLEMGLEAAVLVTDEPYLSEHNGDFLRDSAHLAFVFVSDEDDISPSSVDAYISTLQALKGDAGFREDNAVTFISITGVTEPSNENQSSCEGSGGVAEYGARYVAIAERTGGLAQSICDDFSDVLNTVGLTLSGMESEFALSVLPDPSTIRIDLYEGMDEKTFVGNLTIGEDVSLVLRENEHGHQWVALVFETDQLLPAGAIIHTEYEELPPNNSIESYF